MQITHVEELLNAHDDGAFLDVAKFNHHAFGTCRISGASPYWEMHPDTDEFFYVVDGMLEFTLLLDDGPCVKHVPAGSVAVVPKGIWHRPGAPNGASFLYMTPGETLHSDKEDPRVE